MVVRTTFLDHPKFKQFKNLLGVKHAADFLIRLWGHCEEDRRRANWGKVDAAYVERICCWHGPKGKLWSALITPYYDRPGFIHHSKDGDLIITGWEEHNSGMTSKWVNGNKGGRPPKPTVPAEHHTMPPSGCRREESGVEWSSAEESGGESRAHKPTYSDVWKWATHRNGLGENPPFTSDEVRDAYNAMEASAFASGDWRWGKGICYNWPNAIEIKIREAREKKSGAPQLSGAQVIALEKRKEALQKQYNDPELTSEQRSNIRTELAEINEKLRRAIE
jgi:hypothetical protein